MSVKEGEHFEEEGLNKIEKEIEDTLKYRIFSFLYAKYENFQVIAVGIKIIRALEIIRVKKFIPNSIL